MARSKPPRKKLLPAPNTAERARRDRVLAGVADYCRNLSIVCIVAPIVDPLLGGDEKTSIARSVVGVGFAVVFFVASVIFDARRKD